ncbi:MAG: hypothetical protein E7349_01170 [Clostridiales bacterium]|nr:hypothetical protein [Clostridiales bacterium]
MGDIQLTDSQLTTLIVGASALIVFIVQLLLCFKAENGFVKVLPLLLFLATTITLIVMMYSNQSWDAIGYLLLGMLSGVLFLACLLAWIIYGIAKAGSKRK